MGTSEMRTHTPRERLARQLAENVAEALRQDLASQERALLIVSGGSTPVPFFAALSEQDLAWDRVDVTLADERWVSPDADDSNARLVCENLLTAKAAAANFIPLTTDHATPEEGVDQVAERVEALSWPASVVILGMGGDGHTASLFPDSRELDLALATDAPLVAVRTPSQPQARITLSAARLHHARRHVLHLTGDDKRAVLGRAMVGDNVRELPIRAFLSCPLAIYWAP